MEENERQTIREFIINKIVKKREHHQLRDEDDMLATGIIDSLAIMHLIGFLENHFKLHIDDEDLMPENFSSVAAISSFIQRKR